jgi:hypothetical protein
MNNVRDPRMRKIFTRRPVNAAVLGATRFAGTMSASRGPPPPRNAAGPGGPDTA